MGLLTGLAISDNGRPLKEFTFDDHAEEGLEKAMIWLFSYLPKTWNPLAAAASSNCSGR